MTASTQPFAIIFIFALPGWLGFIIGLVFYVRHVISRKRSIVWIALGWGLSAPLMVLALLLLAYLLRDLNNNHLALLLLPAFGWAGGTITGVILLLEKAIRKPATILRIGVGWALSLAFLDILFWAPLTLYGNNKNAGFFILFLLVSSIAAVGSYLMVWQIRVDQKSRLARV